MKSVLGGFNPFRRRTRRLAVWTHSSFRLPFSSILHDTGLDPRRADSVLTWLLDRRLVRSEDVLEAPEAQYEQLLRVHSEAWLVALDEPEVVAGLLGLSALGPIPVESMVELWRRGAGATLAATKWVLENDGIGATLMGGFHHAGPDRGSGFCGLNDIAVAVAALRADGFEDTVLVVDLDAHPPDGLAEFSLPNTEIRSVGVASEWKADRGVDIRVPPGTTDAAYLDAVDEALGDLPTSGVAIYLAGSDPLEGDPLGCLAVSEGGLRERDRRVFAALEGIPTVVVPGGGYTPRSWRVLAGSIAEAVGSSDVVAPGYDPVARRVGRVARHFAPSDEEPLITEEDLGLGPRRAQRFLGYYTRHGLELAATRYGVFEALSRMGFDDLRISTGEAQTSHQLRVFGTFGGIEHRVIDVSISFRNVDRWRTLFVEWLELQDPRVQAPVKGTLPGQAHPGLGMAREITGMLQVASERLGLAGVSFVPSHYHVAWIARKHCTFAEAHARGRFRALREFLVGVDLARASQQLAAEGLPTEDGEPIRWEPSLMVHATDPALRDWIRMSSSEVQSFHEGTLFRLLPASVTFG